MQERAKTSGLKQVGFVGLGCLGAILLFALLITVLGFINPIVDASDAESDWKVIEANPTLANTRAYLEDYQKGAQVADVQKARAQLLEAGRSRRAKLVAGDCQGLICVLLSDIQKMDAAAPVGGLRLHAYTEKMPGGYARFGEADGWPASLIPAVQTFADDAGLELVVQGVLPQRDPYVRKLWEEMPILMCRGMGTQGPAYRRDGALVGSTGGLRLQVSCAYFSSSGDSAPKAEERWDIEGAAEVEGLDVRSAVQNDITAKLAAAVRTSFQIP